MQKGLKVNLPHPVAPIRRGLCSHNKDLEREKQIEIRMSIEHCIRCLVHIELHKVRHRV